MKDGLPGAAASRGPARIGRAATASGPGFGTPMRRGDDRIVSGQKLCQILAPALLAAQEFLSSQNKKLIRLAALLTAILINRHDLLLYVYRLQHPPCLRSNLFCSA